MVAVKERKFKMTKELVVGVARLGVVADVECVYPHDGGNVVDMASPTRFLSFFAQADAVRCLMWCVCMGSGKRLWAVRVNGCISTQRIIELGLLLMVLLHLN